MEEKYIKLIDELSELKAKQKELLKKVEIAYDYKDSLISKMQNADREILAKQKNVHTAALLIADKLAQIKIELDLYVKN